LSDFRDEKLIDRIGAYITQPIQKQL